MKRAYYAAVGLVLFGCEREVSIGTLLDAALGNGEPDATIDTTFSCTQQGPLFDLSDGAPGACGAGSKGFHYALCSCTDLQASSAISSDGTIAVGGALYPAAVQCGGSLIVAGSAGIPLGADLTIGGNLFDQGQLQGEHSVQVTGNACVAGDVRLDGLSVGGSFTLAPQAALSVTGGAPDAQRASVDVAVPCSCEHTLDVGGLIAARVNSNDNASLAFDPASSLRALDAALELALPCGRYFVGDIYAPHAITLHIQGRVALYVQNGIVVENAGALTVELAQGAEFDLFVGDGISAGGPVTIGTPGASSQVRLHFGGSDTLFFSGPTKLAATLYAPSSDLVTEERFELDGAALVHHVAASQGLTLHYDAKLARDPCSAARCQRASDCASTLRCLSGACLP